jgi:hypothetical protein
MAGTPKPEGVISSPRFKKPRHEDPIEALTRLTDANPTPNDFRLFLKETTSRVKSDRGVAILIATNLENALQLALSQSLHVREKQHRRLFGMSGPLGTFAAKITIAYAMDIIGNEAKENLDAIRSIRNAFAHAKLPISFKTPQVKAVCEILKQPNLISLFGEKQKKKKRLAGLRLFREVCITTTLNLLLYSFGARSSVHTNALKIPIDEAFEIFQKRKSLP